MYRNAFSGFSVDDTDRAREFYTRVLGLEVTDAGMQGLITLHLPGGTEVLVYPKGEAHTPATFTVLNLVVPEIDSAVAELTRRGVTFERYAGTEMETDPNGVFRRGGPPIAWFTDPAGNVFSVLEDNGAGPGASS
jgi:catechol 2,3-dioxygenase-like lactoylglutathione lyase family enzyme